MTGLALALLLAAPAARPPAIRAEGRVADLPIRIASPEDARKLCGTLELPERASRRESVLDRAAAEAEQEARRARALRRRYLVEVAGAGLAFDHDPEAQRLTLTERAQLDAAGGALRLWATEEGELPVSADGALARRIAAAARNGEGLLRLVFALPEDEEAALCAHPPGARQYGLGVEPVSWAYLVGGKVLARGGAEPEEPGPPPPGARSRVEVGEPMGPDGPELQKALQARTRELEACYARARRARPGLDGTLAVELELASQGGPPREARVVIDSVLDEGLSRCVLEAVAGARLPPGKGGRAQVPIHFTQQPPGAGAQPQRQ